MSSVDGNPLVLTIQSEIKKIKDDLKDVDENLRRLTGRDFADVGPRVSPERKTKPFYGSEDEPIKHRPQGGVFARLGAEVLDIHSNARNGKYLSKEDKDHSTGSKVPQKICEPISGVDKFPKPLIASSVARPVADSKTRIEAVAALSKDKISRDRNRRMFGALMGTLAKFKNDEAKQKPKEELRLAIEKKLEEKGRVEKEEIRRERIKLFNKRREKQMHMRILLSKITRVKEHETWETHQKMLMNFIRTKIKPSVFWLPKNHIPKSAALLGETKDKLGKELEVENKRLKEDLDDLIRVHDEEEEIVDLKGSNQLNIPSSEDVNDLDNGADYLDYEAEEENNLYEPEELIITSAGKKRIPERMVVQVGGRDSAFSERRVELVKEEFKSKRAGSKRVKKKEKGKKKLNESKDKKKENLETSVTKAEIMEDKKELASPVQFLQTDFSESITKEKFESSDKIEQSAGLSKNSEDLSTVQGKNEQHAGNNTDEEPTELVTVQNEETVQTADALENVDKVKSDVIFNVKKEVDEAPVIAYENKVTEKSSVEELSKTKIFKIENTPEVGNVGKSESMHTLSKKIDSSDKESSKTSVKIKERRVMKVNKSESANKDKGKRPKYKQASPEASSDSDSESSSDSSQSSDSDGFSSSGSDSVKRLKRNRSSSSSSTGSTSGSSSNSDDAHATDKMSKTKEKAFDRRSRHRERKGEKIVKSSASKNVRENGAKSESDIKKKRPRSRSQSRSRDQKKGKR